MKDLSQLLTALPFPTGIERVRRSFARQPDCQTCGASAIRHGLLLGGLTMPTATLEAVLGIRHDEGTPPRSMRVCLRGLGLEVRCIRKPARRSTAAFLDELRVEFDAGAFMIPCIFAAEHWVCVGAWDGRRVGLIDSFFVRGEPLTPNLGFLRLRPSEFDALDWNHHVMLVRPGRWQKQYKRWQRARHSLLRMNAPGGRGTTMVQAIRQGAHQYLDDADYSYHRLELHLGRGPSLAVQTDDPGGDAVGVEALHDSTGEVLVVKRLGGLMKGWPAVPEVVLRAGAVRAGQLAG